MAGKHLPQGQDWGAELEGVMKRLDRVDCVTRNVCISSWRGAQKHAHEFDAVVTVADDAPYRGTRYYPVSEAFPGSENTVLFKRAVDAVVQEASGGRRVLVHCFSGMNRSPAVVAGYLMKTQRISVDEAVEKVERKRGAVIEPEFWAMLHALMR